MRTMLLCTTLLLLATACASFQDILVAPPPSPAFSNQHFTHPRFAELEIRSLAVIFENRSNMDVNEERIQLGLEGALLTQHGYRVVTRTRLDQLLQEHRIAVSDLTEDPKTIGGMLNVDGLLFVGLQSLSLNQGWGGLATGSLLSVSTGETGFTSTIEFEHVDGEPSKAVSVVAARFLQDLPAAPR